ncbi:hypothetical protein ACOMHN_011816 [Nucella lapillus]
MACSAEEAPAARMQSQMGQGDSTLGSVLADYSLDAGGGGDLMEAHLLQGRQDLILSVRAAVDTSQPLRTLLDLKCPVSMKYAQLNVPQLLRANGQSVDQLRTIPVALGMLEKYGRHLLKAPAARVNLWRQINFHNAIFRDRVLPMEGYLDLVHQLGYTAAIADGLRFAQEEPDPEVTSQLVADILLARVEVEQYLACKHPHPEIIHALLPEGTVDQVAYQWQQGAGTDVAMVTGPPPPSAPHPPVVFSTPTPVSMSDEGETERGETGGLPTAATARETDLTSSTQLDDSLHKACDICGETSAVWWCALCDNKQLCVVCDDMWHKHPKRHNHYREPMASLPSQSSAPMQDPIRGAFGIRALNSISPQTSRERTPTPVSGRQYSPPPTHPPAPSRTPPPAPSRTPPPAPSRTPPLQQMEGETWQVGAISRPHTLQQGIAAQQGVGAAQQGAGGQPQAVGGLQQNTAGPAASIQQHQQQLHLYQQKQRMLHQHQQQQQQQRLIQQQQQQQGDYGVLSDYNMAAAYSQGGPGGHPPPSPSPLTAPHSGAPYQVWALPPEGPGGQPHAWLYGAAPTQRAGFPPFPLLEPDPLTGGGGVPTAAVSGHHLGLAGEADAGLKTPVSSVVSGGVAAATALGRDLERRPSGPVTLGSAAPPPLSACWESSLLKDVLAEADFEKRAAKCDVRLLALEEECAEVEGRLQHLMLTAEDVTECADFRTLTRRKARLLKEQRTLRDYRSELAQLMAAPLPSSSSSPRVFHPPPLPPSPFPSPTQHQRLGFSYPHQASQSPQESAYAPPQGGQGALPPLPSPSPSPAMQESTCPPQGLGVGGGIHLVSGSSGLGSGVDHSSLLPQWQMVPSTPTLTTIHNPLYSATAAPRYQQGDLPSSALYGRHQLPGGPAWGPRGDDSLFGPGGQAGVSVAQEHGLPPHLPPHLPPSSTPPGNRPHQPPLPHSNATPDPSCSTLGQGLTNIGFDNLLLQELASSSSSSSPSPAPSPFPHAHCTFINQAGTRVCVMCDRTSDNPTLISPPSPTPPAPTPTPTHPQAPLLPSSSGVLQGVEGAGVLASSSSVGAGGSGGGTLLTPEQLAFFQSTVVGDQDQVYLEKQEAHKLFGRSQSPPHTTEPTLPTALPTSTTPTTPPPLPPRDQTAPLPPLPPRTPRPPSEQAGGEGGGEGGPLSEGTGQSVIGESLTSQHTSSPSPSPAVAGLREGEGGMERVNSLDSNFVQEGDFSITMERFGELKQMKQIKLDGADLLHYVKMGEREGFSMEELEVALHQTTGEGAGGGGGGMQGALQWLRTDWVKLTQVVTASSKAQGQQSQHNDVGEMSANEAKVALCRAKGNMMAAVKECVARRRELVIPAAEPSGQLRKGGCVGRHAGCRGRRGLGAAQPAGHDAAALCAARVGAARGGGGGGEGGGGGGGSTLLQMTLSAERRCQSVSTSVIAQPHFQSTVMDPDGDRERRIRMILVEGQLKSWGRAEMVIKLLDVDLPLTYPPPRHHPQHRSDGEDPPFTLEDVVEAVRNCRDRQSARVYLTQQCLTCFACYPMSKIRNLNFCQCKMCQDCLKQNFEVVIREKHVRHWTCPICSHPDLNNAEVAAEYLNILAMLLQTQVDREVYDLFETKVRDWHLQKDPNFRWCAHCGNGFIADERQLRMECPHCEHTTCYSCKKQWEEQHEGLTCAEFEQWKIDNDPNNQAIGLARHLEENGIDCPSCKMRYALAKGGCMHFKCPQCGHEFCSGCYQPFYQRGMCPGQHCKLGGLHAHHPRDCFFYLRDQDIDQLQDVLRESGVEFNRDPPEGQDDPGHCPVIEQKEFDWGKSDEFCGRDTTQGHAGLCVMHYKEYLVGLINRHHVDPVTILTLDELKTLLKRCDLPAPKPSTNETQANYRKRLVKLVKDKVPLPSRGS